MLPETAPRASFHRAWNLVRDQEVGGSNPNPRNHSFLAKIPTNLNVLEGEAKIVRELYDQFARYIDATPSIMNSHRRLLPQIQPVNLENESSGDTQQSAANATDDVI